MEKNISAIFFALILFLSSCSSSWTNHAPNLSGRLTAIAASITSPDTLLVASPGGGIWKTTNGGTSWTKPLNYSLADFSVVDLQWDRIRSGRIYASTYSDLYSSTDLGEHWNNLTHLGGYPSPMKPLELTSDPKPLVQLRYSATASTIVWSKPCMGLYYSFDGISFTQHFPFPGGSSNPDNCIIAMAADDNTGKIYFSTITRNGGGPPHVFRSHCAWTPTTACLTWDIVNTGLPNNTIVSSIVSSGVADKLALAINGNSGSALIYKTTDGINWTAPAHQPPSPSWDVRTLASPAPNQLLLSSVIPYYSNNWGDDWNVLPTPPSTHPDIRSFYWASFASGNYLWLTTDGSNASNAYAAIVKYNFTPGSNPSGGAPIGLTGLKTWQAFFMAVTGTSGGSRRRIFLGALDNGCLCSDDGGVTWTEAGTPPGNGCGDYASLVFAPSNPDRAYARTCSGDKIARSDNAFSAATASNVTWTTLSPAGGNNMPYIWTNQMTSVDPGNADRVGIARNIDIALSTNAGVDWTSHRLPGNANPVCVYLDVGGDIYAGTVDHGAFKSIDNGTTWTPFALNSSSPRAVMKIIHSSAGGAGGTFFLGTTSGLYRLLPGGTFTLISGDPSYVVNDVEVDATTPTHVYAALGYAAGCGQHRGGIRYSSDNGDTFTSITSGLDIHQAPITDIQIDPVDAHYLYAAVYGLGGWTYYH